MCHRQVNLCFRYKCNFEQICLQHLCTNFRVICFFLLWDVNSISKFNAFLGLTSNCMLKYWYPYEFILHSCIHVYIYIYIDAWDKLRNTLYFCFFFLLFFSFHGYRRYNYWVVSLVTKIIITKIVSFVLYYIHSCAYINILYTIPAPRTLINVRRIKLFYIPLSYVANSLRTVMFVCRHRL